MLTLLSLFLIALVEVDPQALEWFRKGEELIGTEEQYSATQAQYFEKALEIEPEFAQARFNLALVYLRQGKLEETQQQLDNLMALQPEAQLQTSAIELYLDLAGAQHREQNQQQAIPNYHRFLERFPDDFEGNFLLGLAYRETSDNQSALKYFRKAEAQDPENPYLIQELGDLYLQLGDLEEARERLKKSDQDSVANLSNLGYIAKQGGQSADAEQYFRKAVEKEPGHALLWSHLGDVLSEQGKDQEAAQAYETSVSHDPEHFPTLHNLGTLYVNLEQREKAIPLLQKAVQIEPESGSAHLHLAVALDREQQTAAAIDHYRKAIQNGSDEARAHFRLAVLLSRQSKPAESLEHLEIAFRKDASRYVNMIQNELLNVRSDLDSIRYLIEFNDLLEKYRKPDR